jgi:hypothetical protein
MVCGAAGVVGSAGSCFSSQLARRVLHGEVLELSHQGAQVDRHGREHAQREFRPLLE